MVLILEKIRAFAELDEKLFQKENNLRRDKYESDEEDLYYIEDLYYYYEAEDGRIYDDGVYEEDDGRIYDGVILKYSNLKNKIQEWRKSQAGTTWTRFQLS